MALPSLLKLTPCFRETIWGGRRLEARYGKPLPPGVRVGESFELSAVPGMESIVAGGPLEGRGINALVSEFGDDLLGDHVWERYGPDFPLLVKLLDAHDDLSIQVHPDDAYVNRHGLGRFGKAEAWYVLESDGGQIAAGLRKGTTLEDLRAAIAEGRAGETVARYGVRPGDVVVVPPGTVHALCRGVLVYEIQESCDITYRLYDYNRTGPDGRPRDLHIDRALAVTRPDVVARPAPANGVRQVAAAPFVLDRHAAREPARHPPIPSFAALTLIEGAATLTADACEEPAAKGDTFLIPAGRPFSVTPATNRADYLIASVPADA